MHVEHISGAKALSTVLALMNKSSRKMDVLNMFAHARFYMYVDACMCIDVCGNTNMNAKNATIEIKPEDDPKQ